MPTIGLIGLPTSPHLTRNGGSRKMIEKAPIKKTWSLGEESIATGQRDADHQYYLTEFMKWLGEQQLFVGETPIDGKPYQFLGCHITKWGHTDEPTLAFVRFSETNEYQSLLQQIGEK